jgi:nucleoside-diphosphate-sugar epimerase
MECFMTDYLVTGGAGFIGSHIVEELVSQGKSVRVLDNFASGKKENIAPFLSKIEFIEGDIRDLKTCQKACAGVSYVSHQAALGSVPRSVEDPLTSNDVNSNGTLNMLIAARDAKAKKLVFASSSSIYGDTPTLPKVETMTPTPMSPYALSKLTGETFCRLFTELYGLETIALRYFNVFGPRQDEGSQYAAVIPKFTHALLREKQPIIYGDGGQTRDFTFVKDVVAINIKAFTTPKEASGRFYNVACRKKTSLVELLACIQGIVKKQNPNLKPQKADFQPKRAGDVRDSLADYDLAKKYLGFEPKWGMEQGLEITVAAYAKMIGM